jgi:hypothetical protein
MIASGCTCGCCTGIEVLTPLCERNAPGLSALRYRAGAYPSFLDSMLARLSSLVLEVPASSGSGTDLIRPLSGLTTRDPSDPSIALLDAWAIVGDILTFYQERIANEGYLPTAIERRSLLELGRLVGYRARPGVAAGVKLAFTTADGFAGDIPAGTRAQSVPGAGETPQFFETSLVLNARSTWNALPPLKARPQLITLPGGALVAPFDARIVHTLYLDGLSTNLKPSDRLFLTFGAGFGQQCMRVVQDVIPQPPDGRTLVTLAPHVDDALKGPTIGFWLAQAKVLFPGSSVAKTVFDILDQLSQNADKTPGEYVTLMIRGAVPAITQQRDIAVARQFSRLSAWLSALLDAMVDDPEAFVQGQDSHDVPTIKPLVSTLAPFPLANLTLAVRGLAKPPSAQPANAFRLARTVQRSFNAQSDVAPRLVAALRPAASPGLYKAWGRVETPPARLEILAPRARATLFASSFPGSPKVKDGLADYSAAAPVLSDAYKDVATDSVPLDGVYDQIKPGSLIAIDNVSEGALTFHKVTASKTQNCDTGHGFAAKVTVLKISPTWYDTLKTAEQSSTSILRQTVIYAQADTLTLVDEPVDADVAGDTIDIAEVLDGIEPGRWIIVSGDRTDIPNVSGVAASEAAMVAGVVQGTSAPNPQAFPSAAAPFDIVHYTTDANAAGDRLVVGRLKPELAAALKSLPKADFANQQYAGLVELGPDANGEPVHASAYVPSDAERNGEFAGFDGLLIDPDRGTPFLRNVIPAINLAAGLFAWRIATPKLTTSLTLATQLAYVYDRNTVTIYGNVVDATQGQSTGEVLGDGDATVPFDSFGLRQSPLTRISAPSASGVASSLSVQVNDLTWNEAPDLFSMGPGDRKFITAEDEAGKVRVVFGDGVHGVRPPTGVANIKALYRYGMGRSGNLAARQISQLSNQPLGLKGVINPLPSTGGADPDGPGQLRTNTPVATLALDRLVAVNDYGDFARNFAGVGKARAIQITDGLREVVHVTVAGADDIPFDPNGALAQNLLQAFADNGDPFQDVELGARRLRVLVIAATVAIDPAYQWEDVAAAVNDALGSAFSFQARALAQPAFASEAIGVIQGVAGVTWVNLTTFDSVGQDITAGALASLAKKLGLNTAVAAQAARIDPTALPGSPGRILPAELAILRPDITDTILLTRAS